MNRLANQSSLYLRQHAANPVDWYPWGPEALAKARELDRPIFLSVGYSACHWCHVMEHESFEDEATAKILNDHFISIKVDREERPDVDALYMSAVQVLNHGQGGWPMSVWLTPDLEPFYAGTYYPPRDHYGRPAFSRLLLALAQAWRDRRGELTQTAGKVTEYLRQSEQLAANEGELSLKPLDDFARVARQIHDADHGGFGGAPKFPHALELRLLLRIWNRTGEPALLDIVRNSLDHMARGGIFDQLAGGFHRYSTDDQWLVPHFEKMLYDNALFSAVYLDAFQATGDPFYREITERILDYVAREMTDPAGPFYATQDADSEGEEGKFYVWTKHEIEDALGPDLSELVCSVYGVTQGGNWEGRSILCRSKSDEQDARLLSLSIEQLRSTLREAHAKLLDIRGKRVPPARDEKIITAWNGLMISSFARAGAVFDQPDYVAAAEKAANYLLDHLRGPGGRLMRTTTVGKPAHLAGCLDDYAALTDSLVTLYEATFAERWLRAANELAAVMVDEFEDREHGGFFTTSTDHERLPVRLKDQHDGSTPSGNGLAVTALVRLASYTGESKWRDAAERCLRAFRGLMAERPFSIAQMLTALDWHLGPTEQIAIIGDPTSPETQRVIRAARRSFAPRRIIGVRTPKDPESIISWLGDKPGGETVMTYICHDFVCESPLAGAEAAEAKLR
jgi:uncharacterized protein YyaL (SSP411 family)